ncbi:MAG: hypothetical protein ACK4IZ_01165 [Flavobacterium sp.]|uniref:hypothetical protein n=1 Tax=Flavobacterium sp. TaxID=239 RepID=UPI00391DEAA0
MKSALKQVFGNRINLLGILIALLCTFIHIPRYFEVYFPPLTPSPDVWWGLDLSWILTLNYVNIKQMAWGTDFAFTYGPLSYLSTRLGWGTSGNVLILFDIFFFINLFLIYVISFIKSNNKLITSLLIIGYTLLIPVHIGSSTALILLAFLVFWIRQSIEKPKTIYYSFQIILLLILFFIKFNTGLIAFPLFLLGLGYNLICKKEKFYWLLLYAILPIILIFTVARLLNVDLINYIKTALEIIVGYNDIMYLEHKWSRRLLALFVFFSCLFVFGHKFIDQGKENYVKNATLSILFGIPMFVLYKSGFVRGLETEFFIFSVLLLLVVQDLHFQNFKKYSNFIIIACVLSSFGIVYWDKGTRMPFETNNKIDKYYLQGIKDFSPTSGLHIIPSPNAFPTQIVQKIGVSTVDIYPWNAQLLFENKLNFSPRPVFQSYTAYTRDLETMNFNHYNNRQTAPDFVIYEFLAIDQRYPLFDEPKVNLCLLKNYQVVETFDFQERKFILLQKKADFKPIKLEKINEYAMMLESPLVPKKDIFYEVGLYNSLTGRMVSVLDHSPELSLEINTATPSFYRTGKKLLESGVFLEYKVNTTVDFCSLYSRDSLYKLEKIKYYNFKPKSPSLFKDKIRITEYKITQ